MSSPQKEGNIGDHSSSDITPGQRPPVNLMEDSPPATPNASYENSNIEHSDMEQDNDSGGQWCISGNRKRKTSIVVIHDVDAEVTDEELAQHLRSEAKIANARRLGKSRDMCDTLLSHSKRSPYNATTAAVSATKRSPANAPKLAIDVPRTTFRQLRDACPAQ
ncbi:hypothetical protein HPB47_022497 [Ixodes persulcatus]|uniref:Uncharacterized protein n=1 Tax=Ixodes persulcatus TaxID=34615 RepID=A0AC60QA95_IXOPE|nr:hypothetical protein HPB47_022497 [Ixodes persulcatus]